MANESGSPFIKIPLGENNELIKDSTLDGTNGRAPVLHSPIASLVCASACVGLFLYAYLVPPTQRYCNPAPADRYERILDYDELYFEFYQDLLSTYERSLTYYDRVVDHYKNCTYGFYGNGIPDNGTLTSTSASPPRQIQHLRRMFYTIKQMQEIMLQMREFRVKLRDILRAPAYVETAKDKVEPEAGSQPPEAVAGNLSEVKMEPEVGAQPAEAETEERKRRCPLMFCVLLRKVIEFCLVRPVELLIDYFGKTSDQKPDYYAQAVDDAGRFLEYYNILLYNYERLVGHYEGCFLDGDHSPRNGNSSLLPRAFPQRKPQRDGFRLLNTLQQMRDSMQRMQELKIQLPHETHFFTQRVKVAVGMEPEVGAQLAENETEAIA